MPERRRIPVRREFLDINGNVQGGQDNGDDEWHIPEEQKDEEVRPD